ncbi:hypothetical protein [Kitasatospora sp. GP82]|uniref:hypothetical protein n=1 Tax=Kitasatospora sp. GP82 TaxID=3035089 RepID=UPI002473B2AD|nr:hypothetical protein [Kitasatospora sp. GP82]MDH6128258.1 hypothetical protein [Kitasatospora sp. GP82]
MDAVTTFAGSCTPDEPPRKVGRIPAVERDAAFRTEPGITVSGIRQELPNG